MFLACLTIRNTPICGRNYLQYSVVGADDTDTALYNLTNTLATQSFFFLLYIQNRHLLFFSIALRDLA